MQTSLTAIVVCGHVCFSEVYVCSVAEHAHVGSTVGGLLAPFVMSPYCDPLHVSCTQGPQEPAEYDVGLRFTVTSISKVWKCDLPSDV